MATIQVDSSRTTLGGSEPSPTLTNPDMVLPNDIDTRIPSSPHYAQRPPSPSYLVDHVRDASQSATAQLRPRKSLGSMSQRLALQRAATYEDDPQRLTVAPVADTASSSQETLKPAKESTTSSDAGTPTLKPKKSLGSMSQRLALQRATTYEDTHFADPSGNGVQDAGSQEALSTALMPSKSANAPAGTHLTPPPPISQMQRKGSFESTSTTSLDWDAIPEYKYDGEESVASTMDYAPSGTITPTRRSTGEDTAPTSGTPQKRDRAASRSSAELSRRAELILANAKKRLNLMDQNLKGARALTAENLSRATSLHAHQAPYSNRFFTDEETTEASDSPISHRAGHARNLSDNTVVNGNVRPPPAMAREPLREDDEQESWPATPLRSSKSQELPQTRTLKSMRFASRPHLRPRQASASAKSDSPVGGGSSSSGASSPATSQLRQQVQNLNRRISMLKEKTAEDNLRRQSQQNLRLPNPLTDAEPTDKGHLGSGRTLVTKVTLHPPSNDGLSRWSVDSSVKRLSVLPEHTGSPTSVYSRSPNGEHMRLSKRYSKKGAKPTDWSPIVPQQNANQVSRFSAESDTGAGANATSGEIDVLSDEDGRPHEERQDAFDYHNFFLHSTMGGVSRMSDSSSEASDDTARATPAEGKFDVDYETPEKLQQIERGLHKRFSSLDSLTSNASFATATEGLRSKSVSPIKATHGGSDSADSGVSIQDTMTNGATSLAPPKGTSRRVQSPVKQIATPVEKSAAGQSMHKRQLSSHISTQVEKIAAPPSAIAVAALTLNGKKVLGLKDRAMVFMLMDSTRRALERLQDDVKLDPSEGRILRRRLEEARKVMDGIAPVVSCEDIA